MITTHFLHLQLNEKSMQMSEKNTTQNKFSSQNVTALLKL